MKSDFDLTIEDVFAYCFLMEGENEVMYTAIVRVELVDSYGGFLELKYDFLRTLREGNDIHEADLSREARAELESSAAAAFQEPDTNERNQHQYNTALKLRRAHSLIESINQILQRV